MRSSTSKNHGMTLIETLVVISILGIFMAIAIPSVIKSFTLITQIKKMTVRYPNARKALVRMSDTMRRAYPAAPESSTPFVGKSASIEAGDLVLPSDEYRIVWISTQEKGKRSGDSSRSVRLSAASRAQERSRRYRETSSDSIFGISTIQSNRPNGLKNGHPRRENQTACPRP
jgi:prepilin-type N-terminal cleavage/methylation domain-containing protein